MFKNLKNRRVARRLAKIGARADSSYLLYLNNDEPVSFQQKEQMMSYIKDYRESNVIFRLMMYRVDVYTL